MAVPDVPSNPSPASGATNVSVTPALTWTAPGATICWVYGAAQMADPLQPHVPPIRDLRWPGLNICRSGRGILSAGVWTFDENSGNVPSGPLARLANGLQFSWRVVAINSDGMTEGPIWNFTTAEALPALPNTPNPSHVGTSSNLRPTLSWSSARATTYDVYFGTSGTPPLVSAAQAGTTYTPAGPLVDGLVYYWKIVARNSAGSMTGPLWWFTARPFAPAIAPALSLAVGSGLGTGVYLYAVTFVTAAGESVPSPAASITTGVTPAPSTAPTLGAPTVGAGVDIGTHEYQVTFTTAAGETTPGPTSSAVSPTTQAAPTVPVFNNGASSGGALGTGNYDYAYTWKTATGETTASPITTITTFDATPPFGSAHTGNPSFPSGEGLECPAGVTARRLYRSAVGGGQLKFLAEVAATTPLFYADGAADGTLGANVPTTNTAVVNGQVPLTAIPLGDANVTGRKIYRRFNGTGTFKLWATIPENSSTTGLDGTPNASLGAAAPSTNTAIARQVSLTSIAVGPAGTTARKVYRTAVGGAQLKLLTTLANNTTTTYADSAADGSLGANAPTTDTSGL